MILIGISGKKGSGKDLLASYLKKYGFINLPFASELKEAVRRDFNLSLEQTDGKLKEADTEFVKEKHWINNGSVIELRAFNWTPREMMIAYGQFFRQFDPMYWVKKTFDKIYQIKAFEHYENNEMFRVCISDVRFRNEANYIKEKAGYLVRLDRKPELNIYKTPSTDLSETDLDNYQGFDFTLDKENNLVPADLEKFAGKILDNILADKVSNA